MKTKNKTLLWIFLFFVFVSSEGCSTKINDNRNQNNLIVNSTEGSTYNIIAPTEQTTQSDPFLMLLGDTVILNDQLVISSFEDSINFTNQPDELYDQINEYFTFKLINHSDENIIFSNMEFNLRAFKKETTSLDQIEWKEIILPIITPETSVILYPDSTSNIGTNTVSVLILMIKDLDFDDNIRFYVSGYGEDTGNEYGAFIDVGLVRKE